jgi:hypothetical protein
MADAAPEAQAWMVKAWRDLETARRAASGQPPFYDVAVYHCLQAAEKAVKAFLVHHGKPYEMTRQKLARQPFAEKSGKSDSLSGWRRLFPAAHA